MFNKDKYQEYDSMYGDWFIDKIKAYGENPYQRLIDLAKQAQKAGIIKGVLLTKVKRIMVMWIHRKF